MQFRRQNQEVIVMDLVITWFVDSFRRSCWNFLVMPHFAPVVFVLCLNFIFRSSSFSFQHMLFNKMSQACQKSLDEPLASFNVEMEIYI